MERAREAFAQEGVPQDAVGSAAGGPVRPAFVGGPIRPAFAGAGGAVRLGA